jgi:AcrR family transcriptional regulator
MSSEKEQLIMVATDLFSRHGFHPVDVDRVLAEAGVARMMLYNHFPGTDDHQRGARPPLSRTRLVMPSYRNRFATPQRLVVTRQGMRLG